MSNLNDREIEEFLAQLKGVEGLTAEDLMEMQKYLCGGEIEIPKELAPLTVEDGNLPEIPEKPLSEDEEKLALKEKLDEKESLDIRTLLAKLNLPGKVKLALFGNATRRALLITSGNKLIPLSVLKNPKLQESEIEAYTKNPNMNKDVLRVISENSQWMRPYQMRLHIVMNPRTPLDVSMKWIRYIHDSELKMIARSKSVPQTIVTQAKKKLDLIQQKAAGGKH